ncbi:MAG: ATP-dependent RNA helicase SUPV3L1/SUV3 [Saliniramus fredricksonii]|uniref:ATP-dependent RNA helicase SUPV3L1/SUV3 n=1 Tax=Saliniramus fredricksonii TaxID=1653334 RepID=A0A0P8BQG3_9HYPH|nr:MAG: ATP-dependent RNA helicase SUPV3L1/SUV3 [Saliniramus fredricksonii]
MKRRSLPPQVRSRGVTAVLGPTNTGKTHLAIERMLAHSSGMIGLPLRLLAREVYQRVVDRVGSDAVALVTGEEKIKPRKPRYWVCTAEAMPRDLDLAFVAIDEVQLAADLDRGHVFTDHLLNQRGREETLLIGAGTMKPLIEQLIPGVHVTSRPRLSQLVFTGERKVSRLPARSAIVAFSAEEVYAIAELIRRQRGGAAVVLGALSPRTRNAQVALYQSGEVDYLVATDAIGMGLNLDVDHVAFAASRKFDGFRFRALQPAEIGQIAGRAGRHLNDGSFGTTGRCDPFEPEIAQAVEAHAFEPLRVLQWRNPDLDFRTLARLQASLADVPRENGLTRAPIGEDIAALDIVVRDRELRDIASSRDAVERLWEVCQVPDYRKVSPASHADLVAALYRFVMSDGGIPDDWFSKQIKQLDKVEGDIDTLSYRIAQVRTWTFVANRDDWLRDPEHWQSVTRKVEDRLSDALHDRLASRFVDRRTSVLMRRLRENAMLDAQISATGDVTVEGQHVGQLHGFSFVPDPGADSAEAKTLRHAAQKALAGEIEQRAERFASAADTLFVLSNDGTIRWSGDPVGKLEASEKIFEPEIRIIADEHLTGPAREKVETRLKAWLKAYIVRTLGPVIELEDAQDLTGIARGIAFQISESLGVLERAKVLQEVRGLEQEGRAALRQKGVRFGAYHLYMPLMLKPAPRTLAAQLWALRHGGLDQKGIDEIAHLAGSGRTSIPVDPEVARGLYRAAGFRVCGGRAVRVDILERLADLIRPAIAYRPGETIGEPPAGAADGDGFVATVAMTSLVGCAGEDFATILKSLGYTSQTRTGPAITSEILLPVATTPISAKPAGNGEPAEGETPAGEAVTGQAEAGEARPDAPEAGDPATDAASDTAPAEAADASSQERAQQERAQQESVQQEPAPEEGKPGESKPEEGAVEVPASAQPAPATADVMAEAPAELASPPQGGAPSAAEAEEAPNLEPETIEIWRQNRQPRGGQRDARRRGGQNRRPPPGAGQASPGQDGAEAGAAGGQAARRGEQRARELGKFGEGNFRRGGKGPDQGGGKPHEKAHGEGGFKGRGKGPDQGRGKPGGKGKGKPATYSSGPDNRKSRQADPDSPFAKLAALKAQLEDKS